MYAIEIKNLVKKYKNGVKAINDLNLTVKQGEIFSLLGKNGAGKSTLIKILTTYLKPDFGMVNILNHNICKKAQWIRTQIACVSQQISIDMYLSLEENMLFQACLYKIPIEVARNKMEQLIFDFDLEKYRRYPVSSYSGGVKRRFDIALNLMSDPKILFLDEPTAGMDVLSRIKTWEVMKKICKEFGITIFLTTHYLEEADMLSDSICIIEDGKEIIQATPLELRSYVRMNSIQIRFKTTRQAKFAETFFKQNYIYSQSYVKDLRLHINTKNGEFEMIKLVEFMKENNISFQGIEVVRPTLEDVFLCLTSDKNFRR